MGHHFLGLIHTENRYQIIFNPFILYNISIPIDMTLKYLCDYWTFVLSQPEFLPDIVSSEAFRLTIFSWLSKSWTLHCWINQEKIASIAIFYISKLPLILSFINYLIVLCNSQPQQGFLSPILNSLFQPLHIIGVCFKFKWKMHDVHYNFIAFVIHLGLTY